MMDWVDLAQPPIVIIENVSGAPWEIKVKMFEERGYAATFLRIDTKEYYIPQTRKRGYLFAIKAQTKNKVVDRPARWTAAVKSLKRPASAALDDFMLPNDDPRVLRGRARLTAESSAGEGEGRTRTVDWTKCETNHQQARSMEELGDKRPLTNWSDSGNTAMPSFGWNEWTNAQVHRIHDLMDINALRLAKLMIDCSHKTMVWNLSQNVHRDTMGVVRCYVFRCIRSRISFPFLLLTGLSSFSYSSVYLSVSHQLECFTWQIAEGHSLVRSF
jgi:site-specific DNA-cytosine methylase